MACLSIEAPEGERTREGDANFRSTGLLVWQDSRQTGGEARGERMARKPQPDEVLLTAAQAALWLGVGDRRVRALIDCGVIRGTRNGRDRKVSIGELKAYRRRDEAFMRKLGVGAMPELPELKL